MKSKILISLLLVSSLIVQAKNDPTNLVVWIKNGTKVTYLLAENPKVTFTETDLVITSKDVDMNYSLNSIARLTYEDNTFTNLNNLQTDEPVFKFDGEFLLFPDLKINSTVSVYTLNGLLIFKKSILQNGEYVFPLSSLSTGTYIINVNGIASKIVKR